MPPPARYARRPPHKWGGETAPDPGGLRFPTRRATRADLPTSGEAKLRLTLEGCDSPPGALRAPTSPLRGEAKLRLAMEGCDSPPGALRAPTSPLHGESKWT